MANIKNIKDKDGIVYPVTKGDAVSMESGDTLQSELDKKLETVTTNDIQDGAVTSSKIGAGQVTSQNIDWATLSYTPGSAATNQAVSGGMFFGKLVVLSIQCELAQDIGTTAFFPIGHVAREFYPTMNILGTIRTSTAVAGTFIIDTYGNVAVRGTSGTLPSGLGIGFSTSWVR